MPRRIADYPDAYAQWNIIASYGSLVSIVSLIIFLIVLYQILDLRGLNQNKQMHAYWEELDYYTLPISTYGTEKGNSPLFIKSTSTTSLEWALSTPTKFHAFNQSPIM